MEPADAAIALTPVPQVLAPPPDVSPSFFPLSPLVYRQLINIQSLSAVNHVCVCVSVCVCVMSMMSCAFCYRLYC